ncbi:MAG: hypothetical protein QOJ15_46 [Bradyrhizobium sp.]|nr:hypothetical protein [Bradyrhizobium sp.]
MTDRLHYGTPAKVMHWLVVALLMVQFPIGGSCRTSMAVRLVAL